MFGCINIDSFVNRLFNLVGGEYIWGPDIHPCPRERLHGCKSIVPPRVLKSAGFSITLKSCDKHLLSSRTCLITALGQVPGSRTYRSINVRTYFFEKFFNKIEAINRFRGHANFLVF